MPRPDPQTTALLKKWDSKLADDGLKHLDTISRGGRATVSGRGKFQAHPRLTFIELRERQLAVEAYVAWMRTIEPLLSGRQLQVWQLLAQGLSHADVATKLGISVGNVRRYVGRVQARHVSPVPNPWDQDSAPQPRQAEVTDLAKLANSTDPKMLASLFLTSIDYLRSIDRLDGFRDHLLTVPELADVFSIDEDAVTESRPDDVRLPSDFEPEPVYACKRTTYVDGKQVTSTMPARPAKRKPVRI